MSELMIRMNEALQVEIAARHSYFQLKYFVIGKEPTTQAKMWQCLRELKARRDSLVAVDLEIANIQDNLELQNIRIEQAKFKSDDMPKNSRYEGAVPDELLALNKKEAEIKLRQLERQEIAIRENLGQLAEKKVWLEQEANFFLETFLALQKVEPLKHFDDLDSQKEYWNEKLTQEINMKMLLQNPLDTELVKTILALNDDAPVKQGMISTLNRFQAQLMEMKEDVKKKIGKSKQEA